MLLIVNPRGVVHCLYDEAIDLSALGTLTIRRASHVEPDAQGRWWSDLTPAGGPRVGPFAPVRGAGCGAALARGARVAVLARIGCRTCPVSPSFRGRGGDHPSRPFLFSHPKKGGARDYPLAGAGPPVSRGAAP